MIQSSRQRKVSLRPDFSDVSDARRRNMAAVRAKNTKPELLVRQGLHRMGYRYRLHDRRLPGSPDLVFPGRRAVIFVHGCFFHQHPDPACRNAALPKTRREWWEQKLATNRARDAAVIAALKAAAWRCEVVWECETRRDPSAVIARLHRFLGPPGPRG